MLCDACDTREGVESRVKRENLRYAVLLHYCQMHRITCGESVVGEYNLLRPLHRGSIHGQDVVNAIQQSVERWLDVLTTVNREVAMQDFLQYLCVCDESLPLTHELFDSALRVNLKRTRRPDQIHRDIGVNQNHGWSEL